MSGIRSEEIQELLRQAKLEAARERAENRKATAELRQFLKERGKLWR